jgi:hypothetical protein
MEQPGNVAKVKHSYVHQEYPKMIGSVRVNNSAEEAALCARKPSAADLDAVAAELKAKHATDKKRRT